MRNQELGRVTLGLIGAGHWGKNLARNFQTLGVLSAICDHHPERLNYPSIATTTEADDLFSNPDIKQIAIATPASTHGDLVRRGLEAGKDVYVEKPFCLSIDEARELVALAEERQAILMVGHLLHYHPCVRALQELVQRGELGDIEYISSHRLGQMLPRPDESGLWDLAPHDISVILSLFDDLPAVSAQGGPETGLVELRFDSGADAHIYYSRRHPVKEQRMTVIGTKGSLLFDDTAPWEKKLLFLRDGETRPITVPQGEPLLAECTHFIECCTTRQAPETDGEQALPVIALLQAASGLTAIS